MGTDMVGEQFDGGFVAKNVEAEDPMLRKPDRGARASVASALKRFFTLLTVPGDTPAAAAIVRRDASGHLAMSCATRSRRSALSVG